MIIQNQYKLPQTYVDLVKNLVYDPRESDPNRIGITTLIQNPRIKLLSLAHWDEIKVDVSDYLWLLLGNAVHYVLAKIDEDKEKSKNRLIEEKLVKEIDGLTIVGKLDLYESKDMSIEDWKVTSVWSVRFGDHDNWEEQLNPYAWLLTDAGFPVKQARINAILRDWKKSDRLKYSDYPKIPFATIPIQIWDKDKQYEFLQQRIEIYKEAMKTPLQDLPICSEKERWSKPTEYRIEQEGRKSAVRVLNTIEEAQQYLHNIKNNKTCSIIKKEGVDIRCTEYCQVAKFCSYYLEKYAKNFKNL